MTTLAKRLGIKNDTSLGVCSQAGTDFPTKFQELDLARAVQWNDADIVLIPAETEAEVDALFSDDATVSALATAQSVWICYRKGNVAEINRDKLWIIMARFGWKAVAQVSLDETWSALRVRPLKANER